MILKNSLTKAVLIVGTIVTKINSECIPLTNSKSCPGFSGYSIDTVNGIFPLNSLPHYTDVNSFDTYIENYSEFLARNFTLDLAKNSSCNTKDMEQYSLSNLRYLKTYACNFVLNSGKNQCQNPAKKVCKSVCSDFVNSFQGLVNNFNTCLNQKVVSDSISFQNSRCTKNTSNFSANQNCVDSSNETNCGLKSAADAQTYCSASNSDPCCSSIGANSSTNTNGGSVVSNAQEGTGTVNNVVQGDGTQSGQQQPAATGTSSSKVANSDSSDKKGNNSKGGGFKLWIIVSLVCSLLVIGALIYFYKNGESLDKTNNSYYEEHKMPSYQQTMTENRAFNSPGFSTSPSTSPGFGMSSGMTGGMGMGGMNGGMGGMNGGMNGMGGMGGMNGGMNGGMGGMGMNRSPDTDVLINRNEMNNVNKDPMEDFNFGGDQNNYNFTSNVQNNNDNGFSNAALFAGAGAAAVGAGAIAGVAMSNNNNKDDEPKAQMVNMTNIDAPESQDTNNAPIIKVDEEPKAQTVNMTNIEAPESQNRDETDQPPEIKVDEEPKAQMVKMTEIPEPEVQQNRNTKFLSTYSEAPSNQRISSQYYGESETSYDFSSSKLNIPSQLENKTLSMASSTMLSNRISTTSTDKELNSTPYRAVHTYEPQLNDELLLEINDIVEVVYIYDDGWVWGINTRTNESGACPMLCLEKVEDSDTDFSIDEKMKSIISTRESMISRDSVPGRRDSRILKIDGINK